MLLSVVAAMARVWVAVCPGTERWSTMRGLPSASGGQASSHVEVQPVASRQSADKAMPARAATWLNIWLIGFIGHILLVVVSIVKGFE